MDIGALNEFMGLDDGNGCSCSLAGPQSANPKLFQAAWRILFPHEFERKLWVMKDLARKRFPKKTFRKRGDVTNDIQYNII